MGSHSGFSIKIWCCQCVGKRDCRLTSGEEIYPRRKDLWSKTFYVCRECGNYVGVHADSGKPLGFIPTPELRRARSRLHRLIDPLWDGDRGKRKAIYARISEHIGRDFHSAKTRNVQEVADIIEFVQREFG